MARNLGHDLIFSEEFWDLHVHSSSLAGEGISHDGAKDVRRRMAERGQRALHEGQCNIFERKIKGTSVRWWS